MIMLMVHGNMDIGKRVTRVNVKSGSSARRGGQQFVDRRRQFGAGARLPGW